MASQGAGALQFHRRADQLPALHHVVQVHALAHAHVGRGGERAHAVAADVDQLAQGAGVFPYLRFRSVLADVLGQQLHGAASGVVLGGEASVLLHLAPYPAQW